MYVLEYTGKNVYWKKSGKNIHAWKNVCSYTHICGVFHKFPDFFVQTFKTST